MEAPGHQTQPQTEMSMKVNEKYLLLLRELSPVTHYSMQMHLVVMFYERGISFCNEQEDFKINYGHHNLTEKREFKRKQRFGMGIEV